MAIKQLSVFAENRPGALVEMSQILADNLIDMRALSVADTKDYGVIRLIPSDIEKAQKVLSDAQFVTSVTNVVAVSVEDTPGKLVEVIKIIHENNINVEYLYSFISTGKKNAYLVIRVDDPSLTESILAAKNIQFLAENDIKNL